MIIRISTTMIVTAEEIAACEAIARARNAASDRAGAWSEATRRCPLTPFEIHRQSEIAATAMQKLTGRPKDDSTYHRSVHNGTDVLADFQLYGIGIVDLKSTRTPYEPLKVRQAAVRQKRPADAYVLLDVRETESIAVVTFRGIVDYNTFMIEATKRMEKTQNGYEDEVLVFSRKFLRHHLECNQEKKWSIVEDGKLF